MSSSTMEAMTVFCTGYVPAGLEMAGLATWLLWAALIAGAAAALLEIVVKIREAMRAQEEEGVADDVPEKRGFTPVKEVAEAIKGLVEALAKAPLWLALFAVGIMVFWVPGIAVSDACGSKKILENSAGNASFGNESTPADDIEQTNRNAKPK